jgi:hypothetical protein
MRTRESFSRPFGRNVVSDDNSAPPKGRELQNEQTHAAKRRVFHPGFGRNFQPGVKLPNHSHSQGTLVTEHLVNTTGLADVGHGVLYREVTLLHDEFDGFDRIGQIKREVLGLISFD